MYRLASILILPALVSPPAPLPGSDNACTDTANFAARAASLDLQEELLLSFANCANVSDPDDAAECIEEAWEEYFEARLEVREILHSRLDLCGLLGEAPYDPEIDPDDFVTGVDNEFLPLVVGRTLIYEVMTDEGLEHIEVSVPGTTTEILGVECTVVRDTVTLDGEIVEDTWDWFAQDKDGNVWYFGELSMEFEDGELVSLEGSWKAGEEHAKPGIVMLGDPVVGTTYRQEFLLEDAEDAGTVLAQGVSVTVALGSYDGCLQTEDFTPLEPGQAEHKFYAPGIGVVMELDLESGEMLELVAIL